MKTVDEYLAVARERLPHSKSIVFLSKAASTGVFSIVGFVTRVFESLECCEQSMSSNIYFSKVMYAQTHLYNTPNVMHHMDTTINTFL